LRAGDLVAIRGVGGLGRLGIQYAHRMGFRVATIAHGADKQERAKKLGTHIYIDSATEDPAEELKKLGGVKAILATAPNSASMGPLFPGLAARVKLIIAGSDLQDMSLSSADLLFGGRVVKSVLTGTSIDEEDT
jgi:propanol-preferring alcohol dehydrogenase